MGEQAGPVEEELERALVSMRVGFLSGSSQIAAGVASLDEALTDAPDDERERVSAAVTQIVNTQARLTARMESLPAAAWDRFKIMVSAVKAQQAALDQLGDLVQQHVLPRQIDNLSISPLPDASPAFPDDDPPPPFPDDPPPSSFSEAFPGDPPPPAFEPAPRRGESFMRARQALQALDVERTHETRRSRRRVAAEDDDPRSLLARIRDRTAGYRGLAAMIAAAVALALVPGETRHKLQDFTAKVVAMVTSAAETRPSGGGSAGGGSATVEMKPPPASPPSEAAPRPAAPRTEVAQRPQERVPPQPAVAAVADRPERIDRPAPAAPAAPAQKPMARPVQTPPPAPVEVAAVAPRPEPPASRLQPDETLTASPADADEPATSPAGIPPAGQAEEQFVPVVFTHKNYDTVMQAMTDLKQRFPNILIGRKGEVQPVDLGKKGIWHRLVFLPAVPRPEATKLCDQLMAKGYDRCWVKEY